jgi:hypothetical protein
VQPRRGGENISEQNSPWARDLIKKLDREAGEELL